MTDPFPVDQTRWQPLGSGRMAPAGSLTDPALAARLSAYKRDVAGNYHSITPDDIETALPSGPFIVSEKVDGETWFLHLDGQSVSLLSPVGKVVTGIPVTEEARRILGTWTGLLAGELYAESTNGRPRVFDLHAAMGGGPDAQTDRLRFAAFDILDDNGTDPQSQTYEDRIQRLQAIVAGGTLVHAASFETLTSPAEVVAAFERIVVEGGAEGIVVHVPGGRVYKIKPEITIDAAVVGYGAGDNSLNELLLGLLKQDGIYQLIGRVRSAMAYPILLVLVGFATVAFLVTFAVPTLAQTFADMGSSMPLPTVILMKFSDALREQGPVLAAAAVVVLLVGIQILRTERGKRWLDVAKLRTPALGRVYQKLAISRFARTLGTLLDSGVPILNALSLAEGSTGNRIYAEAIAAAAEDVRAGESLAPQLDKSHCFPPMVIDMMAIGEESGNLGGCLVRLADRNERDLDNALRIFVSLLEPCILIVLGAFVLFIVLAMLLPVFTMSTLVM